MNDLKTNLNKVRARIDRATELARRPAGSVMLLAVSKQQTAERIRALYDAGQRHFGENYQQEALQKQQQLADLDIVWHFIGPLQSNKTREVAQHFSWVHSVDREKLLQRLSDQRPGSLSPLNICLQVNIDLEPQKAGAKPEDVAALARLASTLPGLELRGLMAIPSVQQINQTDADSFVRMKLLFEELKSRGLQIDTLSMGMSADLEAAIAAGSNLVRIGTDLFGPRHA